MPGGYGDGYYGAAAGTYANLDGTALGPFPNAANPPPVVGRGFLYFFGKNFGAFGPRRFVGAPRLNGFAAGAVPQARTAATEKIVFDVALQDPSALLDPLTSEVTVDKAGVWTFAVGAAVGFTPAAVAPGDTVSIDLAVNGAPVANVGTFTAPNPAGNIVGLDFYDDFAGDGGGAVWGFGPSGVLWHLDAAGNPVSYPLNNTYNFNFASRSIIVNAGDKVTALITWPAGVGAGLANARLWFNAAVDYEPHGPDVTVNI